ncbi:Uncharacterised protein [Mycobacterium tuberculosis]|nr:Uncharacterised protein [Mycobacterium tuberculosis]CNN01353.1 Uncharacterised protein [Mycobacterium tuberculosis]
MGVDDRCGGQAGAAGDLGEVWAVVDDVDYQVASVIGRSHRLGGDPQPAQPLTGDPLVAGRVQLHQYGARGRNDVDHTG